MSVPVDLDKLAGTLTEFGSGYLITVGEDFCAHIIAVEPVLIEGVLDTGPAGTTTGRNVAAHPDVTVLWPPHEPGGFTLIVDGRAELAGDHVRIRPAHAVLHRKVAARNDCRPLEK